MKLCGMVGHNPRTSRLGFERPGDKVKVTEVQLGHTLIFR